LSIAEHLVQRKAALRAEQRRRRQARAGDGEMAAAAVADRLIGAFGLPPPLAIGVAFAAQEVDEAPMGRRDEPLGAMVTERAGHACPRLPAAASAAAPG
jgi:hypothetical protein